MSPTEITFFSVTLFLALAALLTWKRRHDIMQDRLNKGLRGYVASGSVRRIREEASEDEELITA
jgi:hypothetical protein